MFRSTILALVAFALFASSGSLRAQTPEEPAPAPADTIAVDWWFKANQYEASEGVKVAVICPAAPQSIDQRVWGTDVYTDDSAICTAATHAGLITLDAGGTVVVEILGAQESYAASNRNGVTSAEYGGWNRSFRFIVLGAEEEDAATP